MYYKCIILKIICIYVKNDLHTLSIRIAWVNGSIQVSKYTIVNVYFMWSYLHTRNLYRTLDCDTRFDVYRTHILRINVIYMETQMFYPSRHMRLILLHYNVGLLRFQFMSLPERRIVHKECMLLHVRDAWWIVGCNEENTPHAAQRQELLWVRLKPQ